MARKALLSVMILALLSGCSRKLGLPRLDPKLREELKNHIEAHYMSPEDYIIGKFKDHSIVIIGEQHRTRHDVELIQNLIPKLYENGIFALATEFARREDQYLIDSLINDLTYDEKLARDITFNQYIHWGYKEYIDIYKVAWRLNQSLPEGGRRFRILGINDSPDWSIIKTQEDRENDAVKKKVWRGGGEHLWAKVILDEVVKKCEKALVYAGMHHAFTEYKQPIFDEKRRVFVRFEDRRMGNFIYEEIGKLSITISLHAPWNSSDGYNANLVYPVDGVIDALMRDMKPVYRRVGFDTRGTPFGKLTGETSIYKHGYGQFTLGMFCDGYIYQMPLSEYEGVTPVKGFVNEGNIEQARLQSPNPWFRNATIEDFYDTAAKSADIKKRYARFR